MRPKFLFRTFLKRFKHFQMDLNFADSEGDDHDMPEQFPLIAMIEHLEQTYQEHFNLGVPFTPTWLDILRECYHRAALRQNVPRHSPLPPVRPTRTYEIYERTRRLERYFKVAMFIAGLEALIIIFLLA